jgi:hypothetical protein
MNGCIFNNLADTEQLEYIAGNIIGHGSGMAVTVEISGTLDRPVMAVWETAEGCGVV